MLARGLLEVVVVLTLLGAGGGGWLGSQVGDEFVVLWGCVSGGLLGLSLSITLMMLIFIAT